VGETPTNAAAGSGGESAGAEPAKNAQSKEGTQSSQAATNGGPNSVTQVADGAKSDSAPAASNGPVVVKKPVVREDAGEVKQASAEADTEEKPPLHQHPTLVGMLRRNNDFRSRIGMRPHRMSPTLTAAAQDHANYMARTRDFNHYSNLGPVGRALKYGFRGGVLENIAWGYTTIDSAFDGWRFSGGHWANMTSNTTDAGFGYAVSPDGTGYWVAVYGTDPDPQPEAPAKEKESEVKQASGEAPAKSEPTEKSTGK